MLSSASTIPTKNLSSSRQHKQATHADHNKFSPAHTFHLFILLLQCSCVSMGYRGKLVSVKKQSTFQWSLAAVNEQSVIFGFIRALSKRRFFSFNLDANSSVEDFDKLRSWTRSFSSFWEKAYGASSLRTVSSYYSSSGTLKDSWSLMPGSSPKAGTGISAQWVIQYQDTWGCFGSFCWSQSHKKQNLAQVFSCEFYKISKNTFFTEHLRTIASESHHHQMDFDRSM